MSILAAIFSVQVMADTAARVAAESQRASDPTIDDIEAQLAGMPQIDPPVIHRFTPGLYIREITLAAGSLLTSMVHRTEHPFVISKGRIKVFSDNEGTVEYTAPFTGITRPGTRRILYAVEETVWTTFHPTDETDVEKIGLAILDPSANPLIPAGHPALDGWRKSLPPSTPVLTS